MNAPQPRIMKECNFSFYDHFLLIFLIFPNFLSLFSFFCLDNIFHLRWNWLRFFFFGFFGKNLMTSIWGHFWLYWLSNVGKFRKGILKMLDGRNFWNFKSRNFPDYYKKDNFGLDLNTFDFPYYPMKLTDKSNWGRSHFFFGHVS